LTLSGLQPEREAEIIEDVARQLDDAYREALASGASAAEARARAEQHVADWVALAREVAATTRSREPKLNRWCRQQDDRALTAHGRLGHLARLRQDVVHGWRTFRGAPGVAAVAILSLALGIGASTAIFSVIRALMLRPLAVPHAEQLVAVTDPETEGMAMGVEDGTRTLLSYHEFEGLRAGAAGVTDGLLAFGSTSLPVPVSLSGTDASRAAFVCLASGEYFPTLGIMPTAGRLFGPEVNEGRLAHPIAVVSDRFWRTRLDGDPRAVGRTIRIRRTTFEVIGIAPATFTGLMVGGQTDIWVPLRMQEAVAPGRDWLTQPPGTARRTMFLHVVGRLKTGVSRAQAEAALNAAFRRGLQADGEQITDPDRRRLLLDANLALRDARYGLSSVRAEYRRPLRVLMALVGVLLLLTCANVANLLLAKATGRRRELALRVALGAGRARLIRQLLTESVMLAGIGAIVGLVVAYWGDRLLLRLASTAATPIPLETPLDLTVLAFTAAVTFVTGILFGLAPALRATAVDLNVVLRGTASNIAGTTRHRGRVPLGKILAGAQVALSLLLVITAGLFVRSLQRLADVPLGYETDHLVQVRLNPLVDGYQQPAVAALFENVQARMAAVPGVRGVTFSGNGLFYGRELGGPLSIVGMTPPAGLEMNARYDLVVPDYFTTLGIPILAGRDVSPQDSTGLFGCWPNQTAATYFFRDENPIGRRVISHFSFGNAECEIRGVVADTRTQSVRGDPEVRLYLPFFGSPVKPTDAVLAVRTAGDPMSLVPQLRRAIRETDPNLTPGTFYTVPDLIGTNLAQDRLTAQLSSLFSVMAVVLASIGLYGVLSYGVGRRAGEIGVRLALGASRSGILGLIVREALVMTASGLVVGVAGAWAATRLIETQLFGLTARDPLTFAAAAALLLAVSVMAAIVPAWRASRTDPLTALRAQ
jgi:predicted permease